MQEDSKGEKEKREENKKGNSFTWLDCSLKCKLLVWIRNLFDLLSGSGGYFVIRFLIYIVFTVAIIILYFSFSDILMQLLKGKELFKWTFNLVLFTLFALIVSALGQRLSSNNSNSTKSDNNNSNNKNSIKSDDSAFFFHMISVKALFIWAAVLVIVYSIAYNELSIAHSQFCLIHTIELYSKSIWILIYYVVFVLVIFYFGKKFLDTIGYITASGRTYKKMEVLINSPLNKEYLTLWNSFWENERFDNSYDEDVLLVAFVLKIAGKKIFQCKDDIKVAIDALRGFNESIENRYAEALKCEVLNIAARSSHYYPERLPEYLVKVLKGYKQLIHENREVCKKYTALGFLYKNSFENLDTISYKYGYLDELIYQIIVTMRKSIEKVLENSPDKDTKVAIVAKMAVVLYELFKNMDATEGVDKLPLSFRENSGKWREELESLLKELNNIMNTKSTFMINGIPIRTPKSRGDYITRNAIDNKIKDFSKVRKGFIRNNLDLSIEKVKDTIKKTLNKLESNSFE
jgi:hypothetical protein